MSCSAVFLWSANSHPKGQKFLFVRWIVLSFFLILTGISRLWDEPLHEEDRLPYKRAYAIYLRHDGAVRPVCHRSTWSLLLLIAIMICTLQEDWDGQVLLVIQVYDTWFTNVFKGSVAVSTLKCWNWLEPGCSLLHRAELWHIRDINGCNGAKFERPRRQMTWDKNGKWPQQGKVPLRFTLL